jgi:hypothetical protein
MIEFSVLGSSNTETLVLLIGFIFNGFGNVLSKDPSLNSFDIFFDIKSFIFLFWFSDVLASLEIYRFLFLIAITSLS